MAGTGRARQILFRIFYSTSFTIVFLLLLAFCCATLIDSIYQSYRRGRLIDIFLISGVYVFTGLLSLFLYASRLYTNRSVLKDIPKNFMPLDKNELPGKRIWRLIEDCKSRSAVIAYTARPRSRRIEYELPNAQDRIDTLLKAEHGKKQHWEPRWGTISHPGWSSPAALDLPNLEYRTVVAELPDLIEARAVSLAPTDVVARAEEEDGFAVDPTIVEALRRPNEFGMRQYFERLFVFGILEDNTLVRGFIELYERARFGSEPLKEAEFQSLMRMFAEVLRSARPFDIEKLGNNPDIACYLGQAHSQGAPLPEISRNSVSDLRKHSSSSAVEDDGSVRHVPRRFSQDSVPSRTTVEEDEPTNDATAPWTAPTSRPPFPTSRRTGQWSRVFSARTSRSGQHSQSRSRLRRTGTQGSLASSIRSNRSRLSGESDAGSVLRLNRDANRSPEALPYTIEVPRGAFASSSSPEL